MSERLNKYLALQLGISRREADSLIEHNHVRLNGQPVQLGARFETSDTITVKGKPLDEQATFDYIALHKPAGYVSSRKRQGEWPTLYELLPKELHHLKPVGRLDKDSSGLIILSNDGDFHYHMTHPKFYKTKMYEVSLDKPLQPLHQQIINDHGIQLDDGPSQLILEHVNDDRTDWLVTMHEGRNRQIRRTFHALGYEVTRLHRTHFGAYHIGQLEEGSHVRVEKA
ncbi:ribosomal large subunit pseudouridine synthase B [Candidatus Saccharibacteria bacterium]|nr:ribosomal large subunit pseudouridine synthase B [Candidatus Saccharibacteria bacterium]MBJ58487.1 ribosomal large subunit pseudouridine synthase B [Candidatus Saccharibacteria bacterium]